MLRKQIIWNQRPVSRAKLRPPFAMGFMAGLALSGAVLLWPTHDTEPSIAPISDFLFDYDGRGWPPHLTGDRDA